MFLHLLSKLESASYLVTDIGIGVHFLEIRDQVQKLFIVWLPGEGRNRHAIVQVESEGDYAVINQDDVSRVSIRYDPQIFHIDTDIVGDLDAVVPVEAVLDDLSFFVQVVQNCISVTLLTCCEDCDFVEFC